MPAFAKGVLRFQRDTFPEKQALFEKLSGGQSPEALFITCSDSRIDTAMITDTDPGELFICRNAGNIVPSYTDYKGGLTASIEFAVAALKVPNIVVCGHTGCGAMQGLMNPEGLDSLPDVKVWLKHSQAALEAVRDMAGDQSAEEQMELLLQQNVLLQLENLKTHPAVARRLAEGNLQLRGWVYDIKSGGVIVYSEKTGQFAPLKENHM